MMMLFGLCFVPAFVASFADASCIFNLEQRTGQRPPFLLQNGHFLHPKETDANGDRVITFDEGAEFELFCHKELIETVNAATKTVKCENGGFVDSAGSAITLVDKSCDSRVEPTITRDAPPNSCSPVGVDGRQGTDLTELSLVKIGWTLPSGDFLEQIRLCVDEKYFSTLWTRHEVIGESIDLRDKTSGRPSFRRDVSGQSILFGGFSTQTQLANTYTKADEAERMVTLLGANVYQPSGEPLIETSRSATRYFARGHLAPDAAFISDHEQDATYYFVNVAPQFQTFNNGNWKVLEGNVRDLAAKMAATLTIYTGTFDVLQYPDTSNPNQLVDIFMFTSSNGDNYIPAPKYMWKVIYNPATDEAIAFIGVNDPHNATAPGAFCESQCAGLSWVDWDVNDQGAGFMQCCAVEDLRAKVGNLPDLRGQNGVWPEVMADQVPTTPAPEIDPNDCVIDLEERAGSYHPFIFQNGDFLYPTRTDPDSEHRIIVVKSGDIVEFHCHGATETYNSLLTINNGPKLSATCNSGGFVDQYGSAVNPATLECSGRMEPHIIREDNVRCATESFNGYDTGNRIEDLVLIRVGWLIDGEFHEQYRVCQDTRYYITLWTNHTIHGKSIDLRDKTSSRPSFRADVRGIDTRFFTKFPTLGSINSNFTKSWQWSQMQKLLGDSAILANGDPIVSTDSSSNDYFARGHLSPDAAFITDPEQDATYYFFNVAHQWQTFNNGNWKVLEDKARDLGAKRGTDIAVWTGTYGKLSYDRINPDDGSTTRVYIYMYTDDAANIDWLPAPKYYWKVLYDPASNEAVAFVGLNDAHATAKPSRYCTSVCDQLTWLDGWDPETDDALTGSGYMYCCKLEDLIDDIEYVPDLKDGNNAWPSLLTTN